MSDNAGGYHAIKVGPSAALAGEVASLLPGKTYATRPPRARRLACSVCGNVPRRAADLVSMRYGAAGLVRCAAVSACAKRLYDQRVDELHTEGEFA